MLTFLPTTKHFKTNLEQKKKIIVVLKVSLFRIARDACSPPPPTRYHLPRGPVVLSRLLIGCVGPAYNGTHYNKY